ncbi:MAG: hypothetical protein EPN85_12710 [Bacteroidetes bacterium]|nr:MAG: hypothetical protein EPN85_12710 [Bacteroidota bacterium]
METEKKKSWFKRHKILTGILAIILFFIIIGTIGGSKSTTNSNSSSSSTAQSATEVKPTPIVVDPTVLVGEYDKNKLAAQDKYSGKIVQTTAVIKNISDDITGNYYLSLNPNSDQYYFGTTIACYFADKSQKSQLIALSNGQSVTISSVVQNSFLLGLTN